MTRISHKEDDELMKFFDWVSWQQNSDPRLAAIYHVPNERRTSWFMGKILKRKGVRKGIPDVCCPVPIPPYVGLYAELKIKPNKLTIDQLTMLKLLSNLGHCTRIAWSADELIKICEDYLSGKLSKEDNK